MIRPEQRRAHEAMARHLKSCRVCRRAYAAFNQPQFCPTGRTLWQRFREAFIPHKH